MKNDNFKRECLKMTFIEVLKRAVYIDNIAEHFGYKVHGVRPLTEYIFDKSKQKIYLYYYDASYRIKGSSEHHDCVDFYIKAKYECNNIKITRFQAKLEIKDLLIKREIVSRDHEYVIALKYFWHKKRPRGKG